MAQAAGGVGQELLLDRILCQAQAVDVVIAGGGPIGLLTAIAIRKRVKRTIHIFEGAHAERPSARQGVVVITANGMKALQLIDEDLPLLLLEAGHKISGYRDVRCHPDRGEEQAEVEEVAVAQEESHGWPLVVLEWSTLHKILLLRLTKDVELHYERPVSGFEEDEEGVSVSFKSRTNVVRAHLLVAADGMASTIRQAVTGDANKPVSSGHVSWEATVASSLSGFELATEGQVVRVVGVCPPHSFTGLIVNLGSRIYWQVIVDDPEHQLAVGPPGQGDGLGRTGVKEVVLRVLRGQKELSEAVRVTTESEIYERTLHYRRPIDSHTSAGKRVVLVGDAAHGMHPRLGLGSGMGFEDCYYLAACLAAWGDDEPGTALREYQHFRLSRVNRVQELANTLGTASVDKALPLMAGHLPSWVLDGVAEYVPQGRGEA